MVAGRFRCTAWLGTGGVADVFEAVDLRGGATVAVGTNAATGSYTGVEAGADTVTATILWAGQDGGAQALSASTTVTWSAPVLPSANGGGPYSGSEGSSIAFSGVASTSAGSGTTYSWLFGDGGSGSGVAPTHAYADSGSYTGSLTVSDSNGSNQASVTVTVANVGAGHSVPTGATFLRELWVDVELDGAVIAERVLELGDQPMHGERPVALLTQADHVTGGSLEAGGSRSVFVPAEGPVEVVLRGRAIRGAVLDALDLRALEPQIPTHEVHRVSGAPTP